MKTINEVIIGKKCIIRTYSAGVWFGEIVRKESNEVIVAKAQRLWKWKTKRGISLSSIANHGINCAESRIAEPVKEVWLEAIEIIPASHDAIESIEGAADE